MRLVIKVVENPGDAPIVVTTNLLCIAMWEQSENRKVSDGRGIGIMDMVFWAHFMLKKMGHSCEATPQKWLDAHPDMEIETVDMTNPNPTVAALTESN